jgi:hypothetical protein
MNKSFLLLMLLFASAFLSAQTSSSVASIFFETDRSELSPEAQQTLDAMVPALLQAPDYQVNIEAFTDDRGTAQYNLRLAADRAASVQSYLAGKGLIADKTSIQNWGERKAASPSDAGRQKSRRVDVAINAFFFKDFEALHDRLSANTEQVLSIQAGQEQRLTAANGTSVIVPANAFVFEDGTAVSGQIDLVVQEAYNPSDFILHNLTTMSNGQILQTGGMVCITAKSEGRELQLADGMSLTVSLPTGGNFDPEMELFYAQPVANGGVDWVPTRQSFASMARIGRVTIPIAPEVKKRILALKVPDYPKPVVPVYKDKLAAEPKLPTAPIKPRAPQKPVWEAVKKMFAGGGEASRLSRKELKKAEKYFAEQMTRYERDSTKYTQLEARYVRNLVAYEKANFEYSTVRKDWENELMTRLTAIARYKREMKLYYYARALAGAIEAKAKTITKYETYSNLYDAVEYAAKRRAEWMIVNTTSVETKKAILEEGRVYDNIIGYHIIDHYKGYNNVVAMAGAALPNDYDEITDRMLESTGLRAISDSLRVQIWEKQKQTMGSKSLEQLNSTADGYFATVTQLGWINCDRFYNSPAQRIEVVVPEPEEAALYAVCKEIKAMLPFYRNDDGTYSAPNLPKGLKISIVAIKIKDGMAQFSRQDIKVGESPSSMAYQSMPLRDLKIELKKLNG